MNTTENICVPQDSKFYCLIGRETGLNPHTFFHLGFIDEKGEAIPLLEVGKVSDLGLAFDDPNMWALYNALMKKTGAYIRSERHLFREECSEDKSFSCSYTAYEITKNQYLYFLGVLKTIEVQQQNKLEAAFNELIFKQIMEGSEKLTDWVDFYDEYRPRRGIDVFMPVDDLGTYKYQSVDLWEHSNNNAPSKMNASFLSIKNTCRHSGIDFLNTALGERSTPYSAKVSSHFFSSFPCLMTMKAGRYDKPLLLLPMPPSAYALNKNQKQVVDLLYLRMENLRLSNFKSTATPEKFNLLKSMYTDLLSKEEAEVDFLKVVVEHYQNSKNKHIINEHRGWHWPLFHSPKTQQLFMKFESDYCRLS